jgi:uncharacterized Zn-binding protein involved in type VI secretion
MGFPQARITDIHTCTLPPATPFPIVGPGAFTVLVGMLPAARITDLCAGLVPPAHPIAKGSMTVLIQKLPAARILDMCALGGPVAFGLPTVLTGG